MTHSAQLERVRHFVQQTFGRLAGGACPSLRESILIHDGHYCGRRFSTDNMQAVWFVEEGEVKFYGDDGSVVLVVKDQGAVEGQQRSAA